MTIPATDFNQARLAFARASRALMGVAAAASLLALGACGGGEQVEKFQPSTMVALGDESSAFAAIPAPGGNILGGKYGVNNIALFKGVGWPLTMVNSTTTTTDDANVFVQKPSGTNALPSDATMVWNDLSNYPSTTSTPTGVESSSDPALLHAGTSAVERRFTIDVTYTQPAAPATLVPIAGAEVKFQYVYHCENARLWTQIVANSYGLGFGESCLGENRTGAFSYAAYGAKVADIQTQATAANGRLNSNTLVTVLAGQNDVLEAYETALTAGSVTAQETAMRARGVALAAIINDIARTGARVAYVTLPALQYSPKVRVDQLTKPNAVSYMTTLVKAFNRGLTGADGVTNDGHKFAIVDIYTEMAGNGNNTGMANDPGAYLLSNVSQAWCSEPRRPDGTEPTTSPDVLLNCNNLSGPIDPAAPTRVIDPYAYLWAGDTLFGPAAHAAFGGLAYNRITANPL